MYEVEQKFPVADPRLVERRLVSLQTGFRGPVDQTDHYFAHPCRDFARTDEALRLRRDGDDVVITWKGPRIDASTKTRREIELPLFLRPPDLDDAGHPADIVIARWTELLESLGFRAVATVAKRRRPGSVQWQGMQVEVALDHVAGLGDYLELEIQAHERDLSQARICLESLALELGCGDSERRSYLELLLELREPCSWKPPA